MLIIRKLHGRLRDARNISPYGLEIHATLLEADTDPNFLLCIFKSQFENILCFFLREKRGNIKLWQKQASQLF